MDGKEREPSGPRQREAECNLKPLEGAAPAAQDRRARQSHRNRYRVADDEGKMYCATGWSKSSIFFTSCSASCFFSDC